MLHVQQLLQGVGGLSARGGWCQHTHSGPGSGQDTCVLHASSVHRYTSTEDSYKQIRQTKPRGAANATGLSPEACLFFPEEYSEDVEPLSLNPSTEERSLSEFVNTMQWREVLKDILHDTPPLLALGFAFGCLMILVFVAITLQRGLIRTSWEEIEEWYETNSEPIIYLIDSVGELLNATTVSTV